MVPDSAPLRVLASDMDGTIIPPTLTHDYQEAIATLRAALEANTELELGYVTGRRFDSILEGMAFYQLPDPDWIVADQGSSLYLHRDEQWALCEDYRAHIRAKMGGFEAAWIAELVARWPMIERQDEIHQQEFKTSFWTPGSQCEELREALLEEVRAASAPYSIVACIDPDSGAGMIDFVPRGVNKAYALRWMIEQGYFGENDVFFAGDSGNDREVFKSGLRCVLVANTAGYLVEDALSAADAGGFRERLYLAGEEATLGLVEGARHFGWLPSPVGVK